MNYVATIRIVIVIANLVLAVTSRKITCFFNPGLNTTADYNPNVLHVVSEGQNDTIHFIWSTYKLPSLTIVRTDPNTDVLINTTKLISFEKDAIKFKNGNPFETVGLTFDKLWQLNYTKDTSEVTDVDYVEDMNMELFMWSNANETLKCSEDFASFNLNAQHDELLFSKNGTLKFFFSVSSKEEISNEYPHMVFSGNSSILKLVLDNFHSSYSRVRYGIQLSIFSTVMNYCKDNLWRVIYSQSISDELSPGVFSDYELLAPCSKDEDSSFIAWRPVAYIGQIPNIANSSDVTMLTDPLQVSEVSIISLAQLFFYEKSNVSAFNLTFGTQGDGFYPTTQYTDWSLSLGTGRMIKTPLSISVIIFASVGLGLVLIFMISGILFMLFCKYKAKDDDLLLN